MSIMLLGVMNEVFGMMDEVITNEKPQWCPGCGDYGILMAVRKAFVELGLKPHETVVVSGIGCGSKIPHYIRTYGYEGIHGRIIPLAEGIKLANPGLTVVGIGGDGDGLSEGGNHFVHAPRKNTNITYLLQDNQIYGLTTGQASPTTHKGMKTKTTPDGSFLQEFKPIPVALANGATFVAATFAGNLKHMVETIKAAIMHKGYSFVDVYQPCVTFNYMNTYMWWKKRIYDLSEEGHDKGNFGKAMEKAMEPYATGWERVPIGIIYEADHTLTLDDHFSKGRVPVKEDIFNIDVSEDLRELQ